MTEYKSLRRNNKPKPLNFEKYAGEGNRIIHEMAYELKTDRDRASRVLRAVLHALRDRLPPDDAIEFAQGLPMALKGIYIDRYDVSRTPVIVRSPTKFLDFIRSKSGPTEESDFPDRQSVIEGLRAVFSVLGRNMSYGQVEQIKNLLNIEIVDLIESY